MILVTDAITKNGVFLAKEHIVAVFQILEGEQTGKTGINLINGSIVCDDDVMTIVNYVRSND